MLISWNWLSDYVSLDMQPAELEHRLAMSGLNHEGTRQVGDDLAIDLEVTSNRPDCLGHIGIAREVAVLWNRTICPSPASPRVGSTAVAQLCAVRIDCPSLCYRYTARLIRGVKVGPSPEWLARRLATIGVATINNVVDVTNYVMMECGQPLHAFDFAKIDGQQILVRAGAQGEQFLAIDHRVYDLTSDMCVIADRSRAVALGGVMGGADSEVSPATTDVLIEAAEFAPLSIRTTARRLNLHSPSSYRFERGVDPGGIDWASRRCCELVLDLAGGELAEGVVDASGRAPAKPTPITLRFSQLKRILGIDVDGDEVCRILQALGNRQLQRTQQAVEVVPPSWRRDVAREVDLVEEVGRIHGYENVPEDVSVPMVPSHRSDQDRVLDTVRRVLTANGFDEALTTSVVSQEWSEAFSPWTEKPPIQCDTPMLRGADRLRRSLVPSIVAARASNQALANPVAELFEIARVYLPRQGQLPDERVMMAIASGRGFFEVKGTIEGLLAALNVPLSLNAVSLPLPSLAPDRSCQLLLGSEALGFLGELAGDAQKQFGVRSETTVVEIDTALLLRHACLVPQYRPQSPYPAIRQDLNLILDEKVRWTDLASTVGRAGGQYLESLDYRETYRAPEKDGPGRKRLLFSFSLRAADRTLTSGEAEAIRNRIVEACHRDQDAVLLS